MMHVPWGALYQVCADNGLTARLHQHDSGQTVTISSGTKELCRVSAEWGDPYTASDLAAQWLIDKNKLQPVAFEV